MKITKRKKLLLGLAASTLFSVTGCPSNREPNVYGMPDRGLYEDSEDVDVTNNQLEDVYGPPEWFNDEPTPADNEIEGVYGPPEWFEDGPTPADNELEDVYGPPEWFDGEEPDVIDNIPAPVYGPPEDFDE